MNALNERKDPNRWYLPPMLILCVVPLISGLLASAGLSVVFALREGQWWLPASALAFAGIGIVLLFVSKLPLYRQRRFFTFGPSLLDERHRRLYHWGFDFLIAGGAITMLLLALLH